MKIKGFQATSTVDYPDNICAVVFTAGCNLKCCYCHNKSLAEDSANLKEISEEEILKIISNRKKMLDGVCITGGEPLLQSDLKKFILKIKELGLKVKLDTNGTNPNKLKDIIDLVDYIAMDVKQTPEKYHFVSPTNVDKIKESIEIIKKSNKDYEFRTTVVKGVVSKEDLKDIAKWLKGSKRFSLQKFVPSEDMFDMKLTDTYLDEEFEEMKKSIDEYFDEVRLLI